MSDSGLKINVDRGVGLCFGPDVTQNFLREHKLELIIRSHEGRHWISEIPTRGFFFLLLLLLLLLLYFSFLVKNWVVSSGIMSDTLSYVLAPGPDARQNRIDNGESLGSLLDGYSEDHSGPNGKLVTVFSAPDYPQFLGSDELRISNKGAIIVLNAPDYASPEVVRFSASKRPEVKVQILCCAPSVIHHEISKLSLLCVITGGCLLRCRRCPRERRRWSLRPGHRLARRDRVHIICIDTKCLDVLGTSRGVPADPFRFARSC